ncbi:hypothetical protein ACFL96_14520 [Thermoproteota archaeon]
MQEELKPKDKVKDIEFEIEFYEKILVEKPDFTDCAQVLAGLYTKVGKYQEGLKLDKRLCELLSENPTVFYNLACSHSLLGNIDQSLGALKKSIALGFRDFDFISKDPDLTNLRLDGRFSDIVSQSRNKK